MEIYKCVKIIKFDKGFNIIRFNKAVGNKRVIMFRRQYKEMTTSLIREIQHGCFLVLRVIVPKIYKVIHFIKKTTSQGGRLV